MYPEERRAFVEDASGQHFPAFLKADDLESGLAGLGCDDFHVSVDNVAKVRGNFDGRRDGTCGDDVADAQAQPLEEDIDGLDGQAARLEHTDGASRSAALQRGVELGEHGGGEFGGRHADHGSARLRWHAAIERSHK